MFENDFCEFRAPGTRKWYPTNLDSATSVFMFSDNYELRINGEVYKKEEVETNV